MNLNQITLPAFDMPASVSFYQTLGCRLIVDTPHYARFESPEGDATLSLSLTPRPEPAELPAYTSKNCVVIYFEVSDVNRTVEALELQGLTFSQPPTDMPYLWREAVLFDPSENEIKIYHAGEARRFPPWRVTPAD